MINIAICDDDTIHTDMIEKQVIASFEKMRTLYNVKKYTSGQNLLSEVERCRNVDLLFLDIEMPGMDGFEVAKEIKTIAPQIVLIYITSHEKYVYQSLKLQPFRFIPKHYLNQMLEEALRDAIERIGEIRTESLCIENRQGIEKISYNDILYINHYDKYTYLHRQNKQISKVRKTLKQICMELPMEQFIWVDRGCLCNIEHISQISGLDVVLVSGETIPVSRDRVNDVKKSIMSYWMEGKQ